jgi:hypothetical protein
MGKDAEGNERGIHWSRHHPSELVFPQMDRDTAVQTLASRVEDLGDEDSLTALQTAARSNAVAAALLPGALAAIQSIRALRAAGDR